MRIVRPARLIPAATLLICVVALYHVVSARVVVTGQLFATTLSVKQQTPAPTGAPVGSANAFAGLNPAGTQLTIILSYSGLTSAATAAHVHGSATSVPGTTGPVLFDLAPTGGTSGGNGTSVFAVTSDQLALLRSGGQFLGLTFDTGRYDTGNKLDWLRATVEVALQHPELGKGFREVLAEIAQREQL